MKKRKKNKKYSYLKTFLVLVVFILFLLLIYQLSKISFKKEKSLYIIIDDVGNSTEQLENYLKIPLDFTYSVLPGLKFTEDSISIIEFHNKEYILHLPLEPIADINPGPYAIMGNMTENEITGKLEEINRIMPEIKFANNHMGSLITSDTEKMKIILNYLKEKNIVFIDSYTTGTSVVGKLSKELQLPYIKRDVFLDNSLSLEKIEIEFNRGLKIADEKYYCIMIGHAQNKELAEYLSENYLNVIKKGYGFRPISEFLKRTKYESARN